MNARLACQIAHRKEMNSILIKKYISATTYRWCFSRPGPLKLTFLTGICWQALSLRCIARTQILPSWASWGTPQVPLGPVEDLKDLLHARDHHHHRSSCCSEETKVNNKNNTDTLHTHIVYYYLLYYIIIYLYYYLLSKQ